MSNTNENLKPLKLYPSQKRTTIMRVSKRNYTIIKKIAKNEERSITYIADRVLEKGLLAEQQNQEHK
ncbi:MAG: hypothetical protein A2V66_16895 [Ignavibacteria bacterium RBG_13_36_8]|nr:MAG: hypothetical protein A2V66_16895 [Ignavibacteria bacterium RBG_13_36_8]